ncbi:MAG: tRNA lysidine(34) synthetase TilS [Bacteroidia bacterium]|nr:tRNA lysidine(34) synthetase TilS [Bacteroidia bacterium]
MKEQFLQFVTKKNLFNSNDKILVAVSGGIDSCVLIYLLHELNFKCVIAHCNFSLRDAESDKDENLVRQLANNYYYEFETKKFETLIFAEEKGISIQMAARELRYNYFEELRKKHNCKVIATAHHADDNVETLFINLLRGTGLKGLSGIPVKTEKIVRPLLFATRAEIDSFARENNIKWREDASNQSVKYMRNKIRHNLLPLIEDIKPGFSKLITRNIEHFSETEILLKELLKEKIEKTVSKTEDKTLINISELLNSESGKTILYEIIAPYGFNPKQISKIWSTMDGEAGKVFYSKNFCLNKDRDKIIISPIHKNNILRKYYIDEIQDWISEPIEISISHFEWECNKEISKDKSIIMLDAEKIEFPLIIRRWAHGDFFKPFGMDGFKKLSDFFIDNKISKTDKDNIWILESANKIVWVIGLRLDDRFKISEKTKSVIKLQVY